MSQQANDAIPTHKNGRKAKVSPPIVHVPKAWPSEEKAHWVEALAQWIEDGGSLSSFCREYPQGPCKTAWFEWINSDPIIADRYARARENGADTLAEETVSIADEVKDAGHMDSARVNAARLRVDARKWVASKLKPKTYADRLETVQSGSLTVTYSVSDEDRARVLALLLARQTVQGASSLVEAQRRIASHSNDVGQVIEHEPSETGQKTNKDGPNSA